MLHSLQVVPELNPAEVRGARYLHMVTELNESTHEPREFLLGHEGYGDPPSELPYYVSIHYCPVHFCTLLI